jgi:RIO kinase 1
VQLSDPEAVYHVVMQYITALYQKAHLVHGDLSEFNILYGDKPWFIDMGQAVTPDHPKAIPFLLRDIENINRFFEGMCTVQPAREVLLTITNHPLARLDEQVIREL